MALHVSNSNSKVNSSFEAFTLETIEIRSFCENEGNIIDTYKSIIQSLYESEIVLKKILGQKIYVVYLNIMVCQIMDDKDSNITKVVIYKKVLSHTEGNKEPLDNEKIICQSTRAYFQKDGKYVPEKKNNQSLFGSVYDALYGLFW
jgi:hypothetical protein